MEKEARIRAWLCTLAVILIAVIWLTRLNWFIKNSWKIDLFQLKENPK